MSIEVTMPRLSDTMESGTLLKWNVQEGAEVSSGDVIADIETDKATMELTVYDDGTVARILVAEGETVDVGTVIAVMAEDGEDAGGSDASAAAGGARPAAGAGAPAAEDAAVGVIDPAPAPGGRIRISPVARHLADEHGIDVHSINGSGPAGRIIKRDVLGAVEAAGETAAARAPSARREPGSIESGAPPGSARSSGVPVTSVPMIAPPVTSVPSGPAAPGGDVALSAGRIELSNMRQTIARRLVEASREIPHYQVSMTFDMDPLLDLRRTLNEQLASSGVKLSVNDFIVRACALAMHRHPDFNASWDGDAILYHGAVNIGMAIAVGPERGGGLVVGVVRDADRKSLRAISAESKHLAEKARTRGLSIEEMSDSTFTLSNLGMFGVDNFTAIINPPNSAILAVGAAIEKPVVRDGALTIGRAMSATLSNDHRVIDGAMAARYLQTVREFMEGPATLLV